MKYLLKMIRNGVTMTTGFDSMELAGRAKVYALANGASFAEVL